MILYLLIGLVAGAMIGFLIVRLSAQTNYVSKQNFNDLQSRASALELENATRLSKIDVDRDYISKALFENKMIDLAKASEDLETERAVIKGQGETILRLTAESEQKLTKLEVSQSYVPKDSFDILRGKLTNAEEELNKVNDLVIRLTKELTTYQQKEEHLNEKLTTFKDELEKLHENSEKHFKVLANDVLEEKKKLFVDENKKELNTILDPLRTNLNEFRQKVEDTRKEDIRDLTSLKNEIGLLEKLNGQLSEDARNLATALKSEVKMQGNWGEDRLNMILECEGLQKYIDFTREEMYRDEEQERNRKPDFILKLPNSKCVIIDSKVSLTAYVNYFNAATPQEKEQYLKQHIKSVTDHIDKLADKNYQNLAGMTSPDYVFLFMPIESALTLALNQSQDLFTNALKKKIVLITPTSLVATLKIVKILWQKENQVKNVEEIFRQCGELYNKFVSFLEEMEKVEIGISNANKAYNEAMRHLSTGPKKGSTIIGRFEAIRKLEAKTNKQIPGKFLTEIELLDSGEDEVVHEIVEAETAETLRLNDTTEN